MWRKYLFLTVTFMLLAGLTAACYGPGAPDKNAAPAQLSVAVMPDVDSLPILLAEELGYFNEEGVDVRVEMFTSPVERDSALQAGQLDGAISDILAVAFFADKGFDVRITSMSDGRYCILASRDSGITKAEDLKGVEIAMSSNTIIEYEVDKLLTSAGLDSSEIAKIAIPNMQVRMQMLEEGKVKAAGMPEPLATLQMSKGARLIASSEDIGEAPGIILFTGDAVGGRKDAITKFYRAYNRAAAEINSNGEKHREMLVKKAGFPEQVRDTIEFPEYREAELPSEKLVNEVIDWMVGKELIANRLNYNQLVDESILE